MLIYSLTLFLLVLELLWELSYLWLSCYG